MEMDRYKIDLKLLVSSFTSQPSRNTLSVPDVAMSLVGSLDTHGSDNMLEKGWERALSWRLRQNQSGVAFIFP